MTLHAARWRSQRQERAEHEQVAVGEVDQLDDAVHHRVAEGDQGVERTRDQPEQEVLPESACGSL